MACGQRSRRRGNVTVDSPQPAVTDQAVYEPVCPVPLPGEPASHLSLGRDHGSTDGGGDEPVQGLVGIDVAAARGGMGVVPADQLAGMQMPLTCDDLHRAGEDRTATFQRDRKSTRLNSSHVEISYAVFCLKKKKKKSKVQSFQKKKKKNKKQK